MRQQKEEAVAAAAEAERKTAELGVLGELLILHAAMPTPQQESTQQPSAPKPPMAGHGGPGGGGGATMA